MLKRLRINNFRSLRNLDFSPALNNVLVGPNASGKSNILDALTFLVRIAAVGVTNALNERLGYAEVAWKGEEPGPIKFIANCEVPDGDVRHSVEYEIEISGTLTGLISVRRERLTVSEKDRSIDLIDFQLGHGIARHRDGTKVFDSMGNPAQSALEFKVPGWEGTRFKEYLLSWQFHDLDVQVMRRVNPAGRANFLTTSGDNFASWLATLKTSYSDNFRQLEQVTRDAFPGLQEITAELTQTQTTFVSSREKYLKSPVHVWGLASGELCFIALCSLILSPPELGAAVNCVEEIENHLNPRLIETLLTLHRQQQALYLQKNMASQVFITTHSPFVVDQFSLQELVIVEKSQGETKAILAATKNICKKFCRIMSGAWVISGIAALSGEYSARIWAGGRWRLRWCGSGSISSQIASGLGAGTRSPMRERPTRPDDLQKYFERVSFCE